MRDAGLMRRLLLCVSLIGAIATLGVIIVSWCTYPKGTFADGYRGAIITLRTGDLVVKAVFVSGLDPKYAEDGELSIVRPALRMLDGMAPLRDDGFFYSAVRRSQTYTRTALSGKSFQITERYLFLTVPLGTVLFAFLVYPICVGLFELRRWSRNRRRIRQGTCRSCGYDLTRNESGICPECGAAVQPERREDRRGLLTRRP
jgi:hypothetical protein